ncbi:hypothetical protein [Streptomyces sp. NPDC058861]|uniref:hypothetical protein n=1 Tax=Streptomyces sp. NPDC058861 TaxID=3346653 RepID=UPI0036A04964
MDDTQNTPEPTTSETGEPAEQSPAPVADSEVEKWKALSRKNEERWKQAAKELEQHRQGQMTDQERALEQARADGRKAAATEFGSSLVEAEIRAQAAAAGVAVPTDYLDLNRFLSEDGRADREKVTAFISSFPKPAAPEPEFPQLVGTGHHQSSGGAITTMDPNELADIIAGGSFI